MVERQSVKVILISNVKEIGEKSVSIATKEDVTGIPNEFLSKIGVRIDKRFGT